MKRSKQIALTLIASLSITAGCSENVPTQREVYKTKQECVDDWGTTEECEQDQKQPQYYHGPHYTYIGGLPYYFRRGYSDPIPVSPSARFSSVRQGVRSSNSVRTISSSVSRGGFGGASHGLSSRS